MEDMNPSQITSEYIRLTGKSKLPRGVSYHDAYDVIKALRADPTLKVTSHGVIAKRKGKASIVEAPKTTVVAEAATNTEGVNKMAKGKAVKKIDVQTRRATIAALVAAGKTTAEIALETGFKVPTINNDRAALAKATAPAAPKMKGKRGRPKKSADNNVVASHRVGNALEVDPVLEAFKANRADFLAWKLEQINKSLKLKIATEKAEKALQLHTDMLKAQTEALDLEQKLKALSATESK